MKERRCEPAKSLLFQQNPHTACVFGAMTYHSQNDDFIHYNVTSLQR